MSDSTLHEPNTGAPVDFKTWWGKANVDGHNLPYLHDWIRIIISAKIGGDPESSIGCPSWGLHVPIGAGAPATSKNGLFEQTQKSSNILVLFCISHKQDACI